VLFPFGLKSHGNSRESECVLVVGEPTAGWIIYTSSVTLIDGTTVRMPFIRITTAEGEPMELHPRPVDIAVTRPVGESYSGCDSQLDSMPPSASYSHRAARHAPPQRPAASRANARPSLVRRTRVLAFSPFRIPA
jgi:hypothetical protein